MNYNVELSPNFKREAKRLAKKYPSLKTELKDLFDELQKKPATGTPLGNNVYKIRIAIASKGKGKSGGARVMTYVKITSTTVLLFSIYDKSERGSISDQEIDQLLKGYEGE